MKLFTATFFTASLISLRALLAQDATTVPIPDSGTSAPAAPLFPNENPPPIVPRAARGGGGEGSREAPENPPVKMAKPPENAENIADNIAYRKAKTRALRDEKVQQALADADAAKTDPEKLAALKRYYTLLADRILKFDGSIKKLVATRLKESLNQLDQKKVRPEEYPQQASAGN